MILWILMGASAFSKVYNALGAKDAIEALLIGLTLHPLVILVCIQIMLILLGMVLETSGIIMITLPIIAPVAQALGFDPVWFGVIYVVNMQLGFITPPFGVDLFFLKGVMPKEVTMGDLYRGIIPFAILDAVGIALLVVFPALVLTVPNLIFGPMR